MKLINVSFLLIMSLLVLACSPKVSTPVVTDEDDTSEENGAGEINSPCASFATLSPRDKDQAETAYVLYKDQVKLKNFDQAFPLWQRAYYTAPAANGRVKYQFDDGVSIYKHFYSKATDETLKQVYVDSIMSIYDKRVECFGEESYAVGRKAFDYYYSFNRHIEEGALFNLFKKALDMNGEKADYFIINPMTAMLYDRVVGKEMTQEEASEYAIKILKAVEYGLKNCEKDCEAWKIVSEYAPVRLEALEGFEGFYDCEYYSKKYYSLFLNDMENCETIEMAYRRMLHGNCEKDDPRLVEVKAAKDTKCYTPPPPPGPLKQAFDVYNEGKYKEAVKLFEEFVNITDDIDKKAKYTLLISKIYYGDIKDFPTSRKYALKAADFRSNWGEPFILIGKLYASSGPLCGPGRGWDSQVVTWPAIDKWNYAKSIDASVSADANKLINTYSQYMPSRGDIFERLKNEGDPYKVGCWIQENTTIRAAK